MLYLSTVSFPWSPDSVSAFSQRRTPGIHNQLANQMMAAQDTEPISHPDSNAWLLEGQDRVFRISASQIVPSPCLRDRKQSRLSFPSRTLIYAQQTSAKSDVAYNLWNLRVIQLTLNETSSDESIDHSDDPKEILRGSL